MVQVIADFHLVEQSAPLRWSVLKYDQPTLNCGKLDNTDRPAKKVGGVQVAELQRILHGNDRGVAALQER